MSGGGAGGPAGAPSAGSSDGFGGLLQALGAGGEESGGDGVAVNEDGTPANATVTTAAETLAAVLAAAAVALANAISPAVVATATATGDAGVAPEIAAVGAPAAATATTAKTDAPLAVVAAAAGAVAGTATDGTAAPEQVASDAAVTDGAPAKADAKPSTLQQAESKIVEGKEPGARETHGGVVDAGSRGPGRGETVEGPRAGSGGPSAPSSLPSTPASATAAGNDQPGGTPTGDGSQPGRRDGDDALARDPRLAQTTSDARDVASAVRPTAVDHATVAAVRTAAVHAGGDPAAVTEATPAVEPNAHAAQPAPLASHAATDTPVPPSPPHTPRTSEPVPSTQPVAAVDVERLLSLGRLRAMPHDDGSGEMRLHVSPEGLGQVEVRVVVQADGVQASLFAHDDHARQQLEQHKSSLEAMLGRQNLRLEGFSVGLGQDAPGHEGDRGEGQRLPVPGGPAPVPAAVAMQPEPAAPVRGAAPGGLNLRA